MDQVETSDLIPERLGGVGAFSDHYAYNGEVRIHYVARGSGPLVILVHGFPDYWGTWKPMMAALGDGYRLCAMDLRGYNLSDHPRGDSAYAMEVLIADIEAVMAAEGQEKASLIAHDWGAAMAWQLAIRKPDKVANLVIVSTPHPVGMVREMRFNPDQIKNSNYARNFQQDGYERHLNIERLAEWQPNLEARADLVEALQHSSLSAMMAYYRVNYLKGSGDDLIPASRVVMALPKITAPVLILHGLNDWALAANAHAGVWDHVDSDCTVMMVPAAGHWVHVDAAAIAEKTVCDWLRARV